MRFGLRVLGSKNFRTETRVWRVSTVLTVKLKVLVPGLLVWPGPRIALKGSQACCEAVGFGCEVLWLW